MATFMQQIAIAIERNYGTAILKLAHKITNLEREVSHIRGNQQKEPYNKYGLENTGLSIEDIKDWIAKTDKRISELERENRGLRLRLDAEFHAAEYRDKVKAFVEKRGEVFIATEEQYLDYDRFVSAVGDKRRARLMELPYHFTNTDWQGALRYFNNACAVCGRPFVENADYTAARDHWIPVTHSKCPGTIPANIVPLCHGVNGCNNRKSDLHPRVFLAKNYDREEDEAIRMRIEKFFAIVRPAA